MSVGTDPASEATTSALRAAHNPADPNAYVIVTGDLVRTGGMDRANLALAEYLAREGRVVHTVAHRVDEGLLRQPNVKFHRVPKPLNSYLLSGPFLDRTGRRVGRQIAAAGGRVVINGGNCLFGDINWVHYVHAAYQPTSVSSGVRRLKDAWARRSFLASEAKCLRSARIVIANSNRTRRDLIQHVGVAAERIHTVYYGNDSDSFYPPSEHERTEIRVRLQWPVDRPTVMFIGALGDRRKGFDTLFSAWVQLCQLPNWDADLVVVGRGAELHAWEQRTAGANIAERVRFLGFRSDVPDLLRAADVLVSPTRYEAYGLGVQEALCCGLPALVSADAGVAERYSTDMRSLLLPDCEDPVDLASRLLNWRAKTADFRDAAKPLGSQMRLRSWDQMAKEIVDASEQRSSMASPISPTN